MPIWFDLGATFIFALTGALVAIRRRYDVVGLLALALISGLGGGVIRDGVFIQQGPPAATTDERYIEIAVMGAAAGLFFGERGSRIQRIVAIFDALGLGAYTVVGVQKALQAGLSAPAAILVGAVNAAGGGLLRDVITREEPLVFKPGQFYVLVAIAGAVLFLFLIHQMGFGSTPAAFITIGTTFTFRILAIARNWQTVAVAGGAINPATKDYPK
ncbi:MAG TPA: TRIC cation channel family protein [Opitutaceae bacterium]|nr:TRIC cation channel family protein [Opitutaceae bacterium]